MIAGFISGTGLFLDYLRFNSLLLEFKALDVPLYLYPGITLLAVINLYYTFPGNPKLLVTLAGIGWGWHNKVAIYII